MKCAAHTDLTGRAFHVIARQGARCHGVEMAQIVTNPSLVATLMDKHRFVGAVFKRCSNR